MIVNPDPVELPPSPPEWTEGSHPSAENLRADVDTLRGHLASSRAMVATLRRENYALGEQVSTMHADAAKRQREIEGLRLTLDEAERAAKRAAGIR